MKNNEFDIYLALIGKLLRLNHHQREQIGHEFRDHLELRVAELVENGAEPAEATRIAIEEFGDAASLARQFQAITQSYRRRWIMRFATYSIAGSFVVAVFLMAMWPSNARFGSPDTTMAKQDGSDLGSTAGSIVKQKNKLRQSDSTLRNAQTQETLNRDFAEFNFDDIPFQEVVGFLQDKHSLTIVLDQSARDDSLTMDEPLSFSIRDVPLKTALRLMLVEKNATYTVQDGVMRIISLDVAEDPEFFRRRIFDCRNLLAQIRISEKNRIGTPRNIDHYRSRSGGGGFGGGAGGGLGGGVFNFAANLNQDTSDETNDESEANIGTKQPAPYAIPVPLVTAESLLTNLVKNTVEADGWDETNGDATLGIVGGLAVVIAPESTLDQINDLLQDLEYTLSND